MVKARLCATEYVLPEQRVTNADLDRQHPDWKIHELAKHTGVVERRVCRRDETALDLAEKACRQLFERGVVRRQDVQTVLFCTQSPDYTMPPNAPLLQRRLDLPHSAAAFDYSLACSGFIYGLYLAKALVESRLADVILLVTAETYSKHVNPADRAAVSLFGDGAAATAIVAGDRGIGPIVLGTDGAGGDRFMIPAGGARMPCSATTCVERVDPWGNRRTLENVHMDGSAVLEFVRREIPGCVRDVLHKAHLVAEDISLFVFHQASALASDALEEGLGLPREKVFRNMHCIGNTVSASIPIALRDAECAGRLHVGDHVLLAGFGVGFSWGACILEW